MEEEILGYSATFLLASPLRTVSLVWRWLEEGQPDAEIFRVLDLFYRADFDLAHQFFEALLMTEEGIALFRRWTREIKKHLPGQHPQWKHGLWARGKVAERKTFPETDLRPTRGLRDEPDETLRLLTGRVHNIMQDELGFEGSGWRGELGTVKEGPEFFYGRYSIIERNIDLGALKNQDAPPDRRDRAEALFYHTVAHELGHSFSDDAHSFNDALEYNRYAIDFEEGLVELTSRHVVAYMKSKYPEELQDARIGRIFYKEEVQAMTDLMGAMGVDATGWERGEYNRDVFALAQEIYRIPPPDRGTALVHYLLKARAGEDFSDAARILPPTRSAMMDQAMTPSEASALRGFAGVHLRRWGIEAADVSPRPGETANLYAMRLAYHSALGGARGEGAQVLAAMLPAFLDTSFRRSWLGKNMMLHRRTWEEIRDTIGEAGADGLFLWGNFFATLWRRGLFDSEVWPGVERELRGIFPLIRVSGRKSVQRRIAGSLRRILSMLPKDDLAIRNASETIERVIEALEE